MIVRLLRICRRHDFVVATPRNDRKNYCYFNRNYLAILNMKCKSLCHSESAGEESLQHDNRVLYYLSDFSLCFVRNYKNRIS